MDLAVQKNIPIHESFQAQFRVDFFNVFNHINPGNPGGNIESAGNITAMLSWNVASLPPVRFALPVLSKLT